MLTSVQFHQIKDYINQSARALEQARFAVQFEGGSPDSVVNALAPFQNPDGGFGHALEPDIWNPASNPISSAFALRVLFESGIRGDNEMVDLCIAYLSENHLDARTGTWATILPSNSDHPHAPWWAWAENGQNTWGFNPGVEIAGFLFYYAKPGSRVQDVALSSLRRAEKRLLAADKVEHHELLCYIHALLLIEATERDAGVDITSMKEMVITCTEKAICRDREKWLVEYVPEPIRFMNSLSLRDTFILEPFRALMLDNARYLIGRLPQEGVWDISWHWGRSSDAFEQSRPYWRGIRAVENLIRFQRLGLVENA